MDTTVFDWLRASNDYQLDDIILITIANARGILDPKTELFSSLSIKQQELILADVLRRAVIFSPSNTSSISESHSGYQKTVGSRGDTYRADKIKWANDIYKKYDDPNLISTATNLTILNPFK